MTSKARLLADLDRSWIGYGPYIRAFESRQDISPFDDIDGWFRDALGANAYDRQLEIPRSVLQNRRTAVLGANSTGKDFMAGRIVLWWLMGWLERKEPAKVVIIGPTGRQVSEIVWRETRQAFYAAKVPMEGKMLPKDAKFEIADDTFAIGFATDKPYQLQGFHSPHLLVIVTEAHGMADEDMQAIIRLNPERMLLTGNAIVQSGEFYEALEGTKVDIYHGIRISAFDSPNVQSGVVVIPGLVTTEDIEDRKREWGEDSPLYKASVLAQFAEDADFGLVPMVWLKRGAVERFDEHRAECEMLEGQTDCTCEIDRYPWVAALDVAGGGFDESVLGIRCGRQFKGMWTWTHTPDTMVTVGRVADCLLPYRRDVKELRIDSIGLGAGVADRLRELGWPVQKYEAGRSSSLKDYFVNLRAEWFWNLRILYRDGDIGGVDDLRTHSQLRAINYELQSERRIMIESKKHMRKDGFTSPDRADMLAMLYMPLGGSVSLPDVGGTSRWGPIASRPGTASEIDSEQEQVMRSSRWRR